MAVSSSTQQNFRKALGALKDSTTLGIAKVNSEYKDLDVAIVKATNHVEQPAKEKHIRSIFEAVSASRPRVDVIYCINALSKRLNKTSNWAVALKILTVIHRAMREVDPTFQGELIDYSRTHGHMLNMTHFKDDSSQEAWDYSAWVRSYALFLEERLECYRILKYDVISERFMSSEISNFELFEHISALLHLLFRLVACKPEGAAKNNKMIRYALSVVANESIRIYKAINVGVLTLVDEFFEMPRRDAVKALEIYRKAAHQAERLSEFYHVCRSIDLARATEFPKIEQPSASFLAEMETYLKNAASNMPGTPKPVLAIEARKVDDPYDKPEAVPASSNSIPTDQFSEDDPSEVSEQAQTAVSDLLSLIDDDTSWKAENGDGCGAQPADANSAKDEDPRTPESPVTGWELALVNELSSNESPTSESKLAGVLDRMTLDSLYNEAIAKNITADWRYQPVVTNSYSYGAAHYSQDPFWASNGASQESPTMQQQQQRVAPQGQANPFL